MNLQLRIVCGLLGLVLDPNRLRVDRHLRLVQLDRLPPVPASFPNRRLVRASVAHLQIALVKSDAGIILHVLLIGSLVCWEPSKTPGGYQASSDSAR